MAGIVRCRHVPEEEAPAAPAKHIPVQARTALRLKGFRPFSVLYPRISGRA